MINAQQFSRQFLKIDELLKSAQKILIASHENPDPDATASVLALHYILKKEGFESFPYLPDSPPKNLVFLPGFFDIKTEIHSFEPDILFCLDYGDFERLKLPASLLKRFPEERIITIDHHLKSDQRGTIQILATEFSSTAEIIYHWLKYKNIEIDKEIAACLLAGIFFDSGGFRHVSTSSKTLHIVSELLLKGVSLSKITSQARAYYKTLDVSRNWGQILSRAKLDEKTGLAFSWISVEDMKKSGIRMADLTGITNLIAAGSPFNLGLFLVEYEKGKIRGSLRAEPYQNKSVISIAKALGGGGHPYAAGFQQEGTIEGVLKKVISLVE